MVPWLFLVITPHARVWHFPEFWNHHSVDCVVLQITWNLWLMCAYVFKSLIVCCTEMPLQTGNISPLHQGLGLNRLTFWLCIYECIMQFLKFRAISSTLRLSPWYHLWEHMVPCANTTRVCSCNCTVLIHMDNTGNGKNHTESSCEMDCTVSKLYRMVLWVQGTFVGNCVFCSGWFLSHTKCLAGLCTIATPVSYTLKPHLCISVIVQSNIDTFVYMHIHVAIQPDYHDISI